MTKRSKVHPNYKARYRVNNWPSYDRGLVRRGSLTVWFSPEAIIAWTPEKNGCPGVPGTSLPIFSALHHRGRSISSSMRQDSKYSAKVNGQLQSTVVVAWNGESYTWPWMKGGALWLQNSRITTWPILRTRDRHIRRIARVGRPQWRREKGQHRQARAENTFYRYKRIIGSGLRARHPMAQRNEILAACNLLNWMSELSMPSSEKLTT